MPVAPPPPPGHRYEQTTQEKIKDWIIAIAVVAFFVSLPPGVVLIACWLWL